MGMPQTSFTPARLALALAAAFPLSALAVDAARIEFTAGEVRALGADGSSRTLARGAHVASGDTVDTGNGRAQMRFSDGSLVSLQPQTQFRIDQYAYADKPNDDRGFFSLIKGGLRTITGLLGKANRSNYRLSTSVATIGIRGTEFSVTYGNSINVTTGDGAVDVCNGAGCLTVEDGQSAYVADLNTMPVIIDVKTDLPPSPPSSAGDIEPPVRDDIFIVAEERDDDGQLVVLGGLDPDALASGDGYYVYGQYTDQYGGYGGVVTLNGVTTVVEGGMLKSADGGGASTLSAISVAEGQQDGIIGWGRWASAACTGFSCDGEDIADLHYVVGRPTPDMAALGGVTATYNYSGATVPTTSGGASGGAVSGTLTADFTNFGATMAMNVAAGGQTFGISGSGSINSANASMVGSISGCSGCLSTPNGSFHGFFAGPMAERAGIVYGFDTSVGGIDKITGAAVFTRVTLINGN
jgi:hypothetical protein